MTDLRQSSEFACYMAKIGWQVAELEIGNWKLEIYIKKLPIIGSFIKIPRPLTTPSPSLINKIAKKHRAFAVQVDWSPIKTLQLDLKLSLEQIQAQMKKDGRYEIRKAEKNQIIVKESKDIEAFIKIWHKNAFRRGFWIPFGKEIRSIYEAFGKNAYLLLTYHLPRSGKLCLSHITPLAGALILIHNGVAYYFHAASTPEGRKLSAPYFLVWEAIKLAKKQKCKVFDFEGIYDERFPIKSWKGFSHFKKSFGGEEVKYPKPFIKFYNPILKFISKFPISYINI